MNFITILLTAFALAMDAFAVSITKGMTLSKSNKKTAVKMALYFGIFQGVMPLTGWILGIGFEKYIKSIDHWVALILLAILGGKMIMEFFENRKETEDAVTAEDIIIDDISHKELTTLAIATSIDALAVGISFAFLNVNIVSSSLIIAAVTFVVCIFGAILGKQLGSLFKDYAELLGGIILVLIGINIFNEHTGFITNLFTKFF